MNNIYFTGFMASGKTRVGKMLAKRLRLNYVDSDAFIVERTGKSISEIFEQDGEAKFRELEKEAIKEISKKRENGRFAWRRSRCESRECSGDKKFRCVDLHKSRTRNFKRTHWAKR